MEPKAAAKLVAKMPGGAHGRGVTLFRRFRRFDLQMQMRAAKDEVHQGHLSDQRKVQSQQPVTDEFVKSLQPLTREDIVNDRSWLFARIAVLSNAERHTINQAQVRAFAAYHGLPLIKWKKKLDSNQIALQFIREGRRRELYEHEPALWGYYVKGAPATINFNIATSRGLVNGCPAMMDSLTLADGQSLDVLLETAIRNGTTEIEIEPPVSINVVPDLPDDELQTLLAMELSLEPDRVVIPVTVADRPKKFTPSSVFAATYGLHFEMSYIDLQLDLSFATTDFKLQGKTVDKLILCFGPRALPPYFSLSSVYVLASRVRMGDHLRVLGCDPKCDDMSHLTDLVHPRALVVWESSYDDDGCFSEDQRQMALAMLLGTAQQRATSSGSVPMDTH